MVFDCCCLLSLACETTFGGLNGYHRFYSYILVSITGVTATFGELMTTTVKCKLGNSRSLSPRTFGLCCLNEDDVFDDVSACSAHGVDLVTHGGVTAYLRIVLLQ